MVILGLASTLLGSQHTAFVVLTLFKLLKKKQTRRLLGDAFYSIIHFA
jgi:hypothetical protein